MSFPLTAFRIVPIVALAATAMITSPAHAKSYTTHLSAFVPTSCSADIEGAFLQVGAESFSLGRINQYCNTRFQLELSHGAVTSGGHLSFAGSLISPGTGSSVLKTMANPIANGSEELMIHGFNAAEADEFSSILTVTVSPIGF